MLLVDLQEYELNDLLLAALKSECDAGDLYEDQAERIENSIIQDKFLFLASEERKHREVIEKLLNRLYPGGDVSVPEESPVPIPDLSKLDGNSSLVEVIEWAMHAELSSRDYYLSMSSLMGKDTTEGISLKFLAEMELGHYRLLEIERNNITMGEEFGNP